MEVSYFVYIVQCKDGTLYTGSTNNIEKRLAAHNKGEGAKYTRGRRPVTLLYLETLPSWSLSLRREHLIKSLSREKKLNLISSSVLPENTAYSPSNFADQLIAESIDDVTYNDK